MIVVASVRPGRIGLPIAEWVRAAVEEKSDFEIDFADLAEIGLPFMDEPNHPKLRQYTHDHTLRWSERVDAADAFIFVTPEYNHSFSPALKNALDYLSAEWWRKPVGFVSYGGVSAGSRGVNAIENVLLAVGLVKTGAAVEIPFAGKHVQDGRFVSEERLDSILAGVLAELSTLAGALTPLR
jgi:NAD(P)H-dependent FMN reductase